MKRTVIIVIIGFLAVCAICLGVLIAIMPEPVEPAPVDIHTPNSVIQTLEIERPNKKVERLMALRTYQGEIDVNDLIKIAEQGGLEYLELDDKSSEYILLMPFEINGKLEISTLRYDEYEEVFVPQETIFKANGGRELPDNYSLLIRYSRPSIPQYQIKLSQNEGEQTATYQIVNMEGDTPVKKTQFVKDDIDAGTESFGVENRVVTDKD